MSSLFYLPKIDSELAGSKLYFYQTGTSTPQAVFTDEALAVAHSQPVVADANGVFAPIYFDGTLPSFRVSFYTSADVLIYTLDGVPSGPGNTVNGIVIATTNNPRVRFKQKGATVNNGDWVLQVATEQFKASLSNTALSAEVDFLIVDRTANTCDSVAWTTTSHTVNGDESTRGDAAQKTVATAIISSTALTADADLVIALRAGARYLIEGELYFNATTTAGMGFKFDLNYSGTLTTERSGLTSYFVNGAGSVVAMPSFPGTPITFATISTSAGSPDGCRFSHNVLTNTAGNMTLRWAQASSTANNLNLKELSWLRATRIP